MNKHREELEALMKKQDEIKERIKELAYIIYREEEGKQLDGASVEHHGYKKVLRRLGYVA